MMLYTFLSALDTPWPTLNAWKPNTRKRTRHAQLKEIKIANGSSGNARTTHRTVTRTGSIIIAFTGSIPCVTEKYQPVGLIAPK